MVAIIPAAGLGTRMTSVTGGAPKELLRLGRLTVLERVVQEARIAGANRVVVVNSPEKPQIDKTSALLGIEIVHQTQPLGLAHAIAATEIEEEALVLLGDCAFLGGSPLERMADLLLRGIDGAIAVEPTNDAGTLLYGIADIDDFSGAIKRIHEKPGPDATSSRYAVAARYALSGPLMQFLLQWVEDRRGGTGELPLTPVLNEAIAAGFDVKAVALQPNQTRVDCGTPDEYRAARIMDWD